MKEYPIFRTTRRTVLAGIAVTLAPLVAQGQQRDGMRRLGVLMGVANDSEGQAAAATLIQGLGALNWKEGGSLRMDWRWANGDPALYERYAAELVALGPDVLLAQSSPAVAALRRQTSSIPIVFVTVTDPVGQGFVESLAHPGGNITGFSTFDAPMAGKWLQMLTQIAPPVARVAVLYNPTAAPYADLMLKAVKAAAPSLAVAVRAAPVRDDAEVEAMMTGLASEERRGLLVLPDPFTTVHRDTIIALAARYRLPAVYEYRYYTTDGGLMSYGADSLDSYRRAPAYVDVILKVRQAERPAGPATGQVRAGDQSENRQGARHRICAGTARHRRRGDRVTHPLMSESGTSATLNKFNAADKFVERIFVGGYARAPETVAHAIALLIIKVNFGVMSATVGFSNPRPSRLA